MRRTLLSYLIVSVPDVLVHLSVLWRIDEPLEGIVKHFFENDFLNAIEHVRSDGRPILQARLDSVLDPCAFLRGYTPHLENKQERRDVNAQFSHYANLGLERDTAIIVSIASPTRNAYYIRYPPEKGYCPCSFCRGRPFSHLQNCPLFNILLVDVHRLPSSVVRRRYPAELLDVNPGKERLLGNVHRVRCCASLVFSPLFT